MYCSFLIFQEAVFILAVFYCGYNSKQKAALKRAATIILIFMLTQCNIQGC